MNCAGHPDVNARELRPTEVARAPEGPGIGNDPERPEAIGRQKIPLDDGIGRRQRRSSGLADGREPFDMSRADDDVATPAALEAEVGTLGGKTVAPMPAARCAPRPASIGGHASPRLVVSVDVIDAVAANAGDPVCLRIQSRGSVSLRCNRGLMGERHDVRAALHDGKPHRRTEEGGG